MVDRLPDELTEIERDCAENCLNWLVDFIDSTDRLVVDWHYLIFGEYRDNIRHGGLVDRWLNQLERNPRDLRLIELPIDLDEDGNAIFSETIVRAVLDENDRKFAAVALAHDPHPPIINATDSDWEQAKAELHNLGIVVQEICPDYVQDTLQRHV
jgi:hypothetical protein